MIRKIISFGLGPVLSVLVGIITVPALSWYFNPSDLGQMNLFITLMAGATNIFVLGLDQSYIRFYTNYTNTKSLFYSCLLPQVIVLIIVTTLMFFLEYRYNLIGNAFSTNSEIIKILIVLSFWLSLFIRMLSMIPRMKEMGYTFSFIQIVRKLTVLMMIPIIIFYSIPGGGATIVLQSVSVILTFLVALFLCFKSLSKNEAWELLPKNELKNIYKYGSPLIISGVTFWLLISMDRLALRFFHGISELGIYAVALSLSAFMTVFQSIFSTIWAPIGYKWFDSNNSHIKFKMANEYTVYMCSSLIFIYLIFSDLFYFILPQEYSSAVEISKLLVLYPYFYIISEVCGIGINLEKKTKYIAIVMLVCGVFNILLNYFLTPTYGGFGAALTIALTFMLYMNMKLYISAKMGHQYMSKLSYSITVITPIICLFDVINDGMVFKIISFLCLIYIAFKLVKDDFFWKLLRQRNEKA